MTTMKINVTIDEIINGQKHEPEQLAGWQIVLREWLLPNISSQALKCLWEAVKTDSPALTNKIGVYALPKGQLKGEGQRDNDKCLSADLFGFLARCIGGYETISDVLTARAHLLLLFRKDAINKPNSIVTNAHIDDLLYWWWGTERHESFRQLNQEITRYVNNLFLENYQNN
jgi:hypothetical protein